MDITLDESQNQFLEALTYYAALGVERVRLQAEAAHAEALREANRLKDVLLATVSHDLRTPLTTIKALAQEAALHGDENAVVIEEQADRLSRLVNDLLDLSRIKGGTFKTSAELNSAEDVIGAVARQFAGAARGRQLVTAVDLSRPALFGKFDFVHTLRILSNLVENALRYAPKGSDVDLKATREGDRLRFSVADRGPGVPPSEVHQIFEPFYRPPASANDGGAGLGLSIAQRLAQAQDGVVQYAPRSGGGSVFSAAAAGLRSRVSPGPKAQSVAPWAPPPRPSSAGCDPSSRPDAWTQACRRSASDAFSSRLSARAPRSSFTWTVVGAPASTVPPRA